MLIHVPNPAFTVRNLLRVGGLLVYLLMPLAAQDNETCEACHDDPDHSITRYGRELSLYVTSNHLVGSPHEDFDCIDCHADLDGVEDFPHSPYLALPDCGSCHEEEQAIYVEGFFGLLQSKGYTSIPGCPDCHGTHKVSYEGHPREVCGVCHQDILRDFLESSHWPESGVEGDVTCVSCHDPHFKNEKSKFSREGWNLNLVESCNKCHGEQVVNYTASKHFKEVQAGNNNAPICSDCHARHRVLSPRDPNSLVSVAKLDLTCTRCHAGYEASIHRPQVGDDPRLETCVACHTGHSTNMSEGKSSLFGGGLATLCLTCHEDDLVANAEEAHLSIHAEKIAASKAGEEVNCGQCHQYHFRAPEHPAFSGLKRACAECHPEQQADWAESVHGASYAKGHPEAPTCTTCHGARLVNKTEEKLQGQGIVALCSSCHSDREVILKFQLNPNVVTGYQSTYHGQVYQLGYQGEEFATCANCHDNHSVLSADDPRSKVNPAHIVETCGQCHEDVNLNFVNYLTHYSPMAQMDNPILHWIDTFMRWLLGLVLLFFGGHTLLWFIRLLVRRFLEGKKPKPVKTKFRIKRFRPAERILHMGLILGFLTLATTGLPLKYSYTPMATWFINNVISLRTSALLHRAGAILLAIVLVAHLVRILFRMFVRREKGLLWGAKSLVPNLQDFKDFFNHLAYFIGALKIAPKFDRWTYWEKFDYLAVVWGLIVIGFSGLTLWFPELFTVFLPGWAINAAHIIHSEEALLATAFIFTVHFFNTHLRPGAFPMDEVIFTGYMTEEKFEEERPLEYERAIASGEYENMKTLPLPRWTKYLLVIMAYLFLTVGFLLLVLIIIGSFFSR